VYTEAPEFIGERRFAERFGSLLDDRAHAWFGVNYLPGVNDIDVLLWHEAIGVFTIEVKAISLSMIEKFSLTRCKIEGRVEGKSPHVQAQKAELTLRNYLWARGIKFFNVATAAFSEISRAEWNSAWASSPQLSGKWAESIIFQEDLQSGPEVLLNRLEYIYLNPPSGSGSDRKFSNNPAIFDKLKKSISPDQEKPQPIPSDMSRLRELEDSVYQETRNRFPAFGTGQLLYTGHPGTGKTFRLLQIGYEHASAGAKVIFLCFNKVLAADIRRLLVGREFLSQQLRLGDEPGESFVLDVVDVWDVLLQRLAEQGLAGVRGYNFAESLDSNSSDSNSFDTQGREAVELLDAVRDEIGVYDTVLIDETQDFKEWQFKLAKLHLKKGGTLLIAHGKGQELYPADPATETLLEEFPKQGLRRNFRNTKESFRAAYVAHLSQLDREKIKSSAKRFVHDFSGKEQGLDFERAEGRYPILEPVDMKSLSGEDPSSVFYAEEEMEVLVARYQQILREQIDFLEERHRPIDLLLLVPTEKCVEARAVKKALEGLEQEFIDLTDVALRRATVAATSVRLCTFHSARGIEGYRVVIFGLSILPRLCKQIGLSKPENLLYVILTRAVFETTIVIRSDEWNNDIVVLVQEIISHLSSRNSEN
jgi:hypothetical protein